MRNITHNSRDGLRAVLQYGDREFLPSPRRNIDTGLFSVPK